VDSAGNALWTVDGVSLCPTTAVFPRIVQDGNGGAIVAWTDKPFPQVAIISVQRVNAAGAIQWTANGVPVSAPGGSPLFDIGLDGAGGAIIAWTDVYRGDAVYAQRVSGSGQTLWTAGGVLIGKGGSPKVVSDGAGGAIIAWGDARCGTSWIHAQRVTASGEIVPTLLQHFSVVPSADCIRVEWRVAEIDTSARFVVMRATGRARDYVTLANAVIEQDGPVFVARDRSCLPGSSYRYRVDTESAGLPRRTLFESEPVSLPRLPAALYQNHPNPFNPRTVIGFYVPVTQEITLDIYDVSGRRVARLADGMTEAGYHEAQWDG
jgi:hypothetical protein